MNARILRLRHVVERTGLSRNTIYRRMKDNTFPQQVRLGPNSVGWLEADINGWIATCVSRARAAGER